MQISICAATRLELAPLRAMIEASASFPGAERHQIRYFTTGIGMLQSTFYIQQHIQAIQPQLLIQIGIAGCFDKQVPLATPVLVEKEYLGNTGVNQSSTQGPQWQDIFDLELQDASDAPFTHKALENPWLKINTWPWLTGQNITRGAAITIEEITTDPLRIQALTSHYQPLLESMEGAALHFNGLMHQLPFLQIRGISNYIGERDKSKWQIGPALQAVSALSYQWLTAL